MDVLGPADEIEEESITPFELFSDAVDIGL
jgi:hypothetical protein